MSEFLQILAIFLALVYVGLLVALLSSDKGRRILLLALRSLWLYKLRAFLSVLGIIIGTAAVIALMAFGEGSMHDALEDIKRQGATNIIVRSVKPPEESSTQRVSRIADYGLKWDDYERFATISVVTRRVPLRIFPQEVRRLERMYNARVVATTPEYADIHRFEMAAGRFLTADEDLETINVCVLGAGIAEILFPFEEAIGQSIKVGRYNYRVVGVIRDRMPTGGTGGSQSAEDFNEDVYIPFKTSFARFGQVVFVRRPGQFSGERVEISQVTLTVADIDKVRPTGEVIRDMLRPHHPKGDFAITVPLDRLEEAERAKDRMTMLLVLIASISLLVGGIGIMNIMLATVTERTREVGIRRALGAKRRDITLQFLVEAVAQTSVGGLAGLITGLGSVFLVPPVWEYFTGQKLPAQIHFESILLSLVVSISVGVFFGWYPSRRAALLDPIEALRHE